MSKIILLTGANGKTGRAVLQALVARGAEVRVFVRDDKQWPELSALGASSYALGDMLDASSIDAAVSGCSKIIHIGPPMHPEEKSIAAHFVAAAKRQSVEQFVYYSVMHPLRREVRHHSLKLDTEEMLVESGVPYTILQPIRYMQHLLPIWSVVKEQGVHAMAFNTSVRFNVVDLQDLADATAIVGTQAGHLYATYELAGPQALSQDDMAAVISDVLGKPVSASAISLDQLASNVRAKGFDEDRVEQMVIMNRHYDHCGFLGNPNVLGWLLGRAPKNFRQFVEGLCADG